MKTLRVSNFAFNFNSRRYSKVILLDGGEDAKLQAFLATVKADLEKIKDERERAKRLAVLVAERLGGNEMADLVAASEADVARIGTKVVRIGDLQVGVCRHRALLYKYCADRVPGGPSCRLVRGDYASSYGGGGHAWNVVILYGVEWLCDVMHEPG